MPVIAKLSRRFYEVLGEDVVDQMAEWFNQVGEEYRADGVGRTMQASAVQTPGSNRGLLSSNSTSIADSPDSRLR